MKLTEPMRRMLIAAADRSNGRVWYEDGRSAPTFEALRRRGLIVEVPTPIVGTYTVISASGRAAIGRPLSQADLAERAERVAAQERAQRERQRVADLARFYGWDPTDRACWGSEVIMIHSGARVRIIRSAPDQSRCRECGGSHRHLDLEYRRGIAFGVPPCKVGLSADGAAQHLRTRADQEERWAEEVSHLTAEATRRRRYAIELRALADELVGV